MRGFTLLELLVVLLIVGILLRAARLSLAPDATRQLRQQAAKLQAWMQWQCDEGALRQSVVAFVPQKRAIQAFRSEKSGWKKVGNPPFQLPEAMTLAVVRAERLPALDGRGWRCWPEGEWTPGALRLRAASGERLRLKWDGFGRFHMETMP